MEANCIDAPRELTGAEMENVSGGLVPLLVILAAELAHADQIEAFSRGFFENLN